MTVTKTWSISFVKVLSATLAGTVGRKASIISAPALPLLCFTVFTVFIWFCCVLLCFTVFYCVLLCFTVFYCVYCVNCVLLCSLCLLCLLCSLCLLCLLHFIATLPTLHCIVLRTVTLSSTLHTFTLLTLSHYIALFQDFTLLKLHPSLEPVSSVGESCVSFGLAWSIWLPRRGSWPKEATGQEERQLARRRGN